MSPVLFCSWTICLIPLVIGAMEPRLKWPQIISHRGATGYVPEHSLSGYQLAINLGTDYVEPDLSLSKDGVFVAMHDLTLDATTDIADHPEFADRKRPNGFYTSDFTLEELKTLRLIQRKGSRTDLYNGLFTIPTLQEIMDLMWKNFNNTGNMIGLYPELKWPGYHNNLGFNETVEQMLVTQLQDSGYITRGVSNNLTLVQPVVVQCFEGYTLRSLKQISDLPTIQLVLVDFEWSEKSLQNISSWAGGVGPDKGMFAGLELEAAREKVALAHMTGLVVHPWTFRQDSGVELQFNGDPQMEAAYFYCCLGVDATFSEFPDRMRETLNEYSMDPTALCTLGGC